MSYFWLWYKNIFIRIKRTVSWVSACKMCLLKNKNTWVLAIKPLLTIILNLHARLMFRCTVVCLVYLLIFNETSTLRILNHNPCFYNQTQILQSLLLMQLIHKLAIIYHQCDREYRYYIGSAIRACCNPYYRKECSLNLSC